MSVFSAENDLERAIQAGDPDSVCRLALALGEREREALRPRLRLLHKRLEVRRWSPSDAELLRWWGQPVTTSQAAALQAGIYLCGNLKDVHAAHVRDDLLLPLAKAHRPAWVAELAEESVAWQFGTWQAFHLAGLCPRPQGEAYLLRLMASARWRKDLDATLAADPGLYDGTLLRLLEIEGNADTSLAGVDKYSGSKLGTWTEFFLEQMQTGRIARSDVLDRLLAALECDWPQFRSGWHSRLHGLMQPSVEEMAARCARYRGLCHSRIPPTVTLALEALGQLQQAGVLPAAELLPALRAASATAVKSHWELLLRLLTEAVRQAPDQAAAAAQVALQGLVLEAPPLQKKLLLFIKAHGDVELRAGLADYLALIAPSNQALLQSLLPQPAAPTAPVALALPPARPPLSPLAPERRLTPIADLDELLERAAYLLENEQDCDELERVIEAMTRLAPQVQEQAARFKPLLKRAAKLKKALARDFGQFLVLALGGAALPSPNSWDYHCHTHSGHHLLVQRLAELAAWVRSGIACAPLAVATHRGGFIDPAVLLQRQLDWPAALPEPSEREQRSALQRLAPGPHPTVLAQLQALPPTAFRLAFAAALQQPPTAPRPYQWRFTSETWQHGEQSGVHHRAFIEPEPKGAPNQLAWLALHQPGAYFGEGYREHQTEGMVFYAASLQPAHLEDVLAEGARRLSNNLDWWEAQWPNRAFLQLLLNPCTPMTPMALHCLAFGLAGKEPGQTAVAVDALLQATLQGRLQPKAIGTLLGTLLNGPMLKPARLAKALAAAKRLDPLGPRLVLEVLQALVAALESAPKDLGSLLELLHETGLELQAPLPTPALERLTTLACVGRAKALQKQLLG